MRHRALIPVVLSAVAVAASRRFLDVVEVRGRSMTPTLLPGDRLLVVRAPPRRGDVVLALDPREPSRELIKRVTSVGAIGVRLRGDNPAASTDARSFGVIPHSAVRWRAVLRYWPIGRFGRIPTMRDVEEGGEAACPFPEALVAGD
jgi:nickel-type superoxide dismutase maturation protease